MPHRGPDAPHHGEATRTSVDVGGQERPTGPPPAWLMVMALVIGLYAMAPGFYLDGLNVKRGAEIVDHVVPGLFVLAVTLLTIRRWASSRYVPLVSGIVVCLAGLWMILTHVGLVVQAFHHEAPVGATVYHASTAVAVMLLGIVWLWHYRAELMS